MKPENSGEGKNGTASWQRTLTKNQGHFGGVVRLALLPHSSELISRRQKGLGFSVPATAKKPLCSIDDLVFVRIAIGSGGLSVFP
jgi:hypothetical protein